MYIQFYYIVKIEFDLDKMYIFPQSHNMDSSGRINDCTPLPYTGYVAPTPDSEVMLLGPALKISKPELLAELKQGITITCSVAPLKLNTNIVKKDDDYIIDVTDVAGLRRFYCEVKEMHQAKVLIHMFVYVYDTKNKCLGYCGYDEKEYLYDNIIKGLLRNMK